MIKQSGKDSLHVQPQWEEKDNNKMMMMINVKDVLKKQDQARELACVYFQDLAN